MNRKERLIVFSVLIAITISVIVMEVYWIDNMPTAEEYKAEYDRLYGECMEDAPEGSICSVDYYPPNPVPPIILGISLVFLWVSVIYVCKEEEED